MRKGHDGLCGIVAEKMNLDFMSGAIFLFINKSRRLSKCLYFDGTGLVIVHKRIERGTFTCNKFNKNKTSQYHLSALQIQPADLN